MKKTDLILAMNGIKPDTDLKIKTLILATAGARKARLRRKMIFAFSIILLSAAVVLSAVFVIPALFKSGGGEIKEDTPDPEFINITELYGEDQNYDIFKKVITHTVFKPKTETESEYSAVYCGKGCAEALLPYFNAEEMYLQNILNTVYYEFAVSYTFDEFSNTTRRDEKDGFIDLCEEKNAHQLIISARRDGYFEYLLSLPVVIDNGNVYDVYGEHIGVINEDGTYRIRTEYVRKASFSLNKIRFESSLPVIYGQKSVSINDADIYIRSSATPALKAIKTADGAMFYPEENGMLEKTGKSDYKDYRFYFDQIGQFERVDYEVLGLQWFFPYFDCIAAYGFPCYFGLGVKTDADGNFIDAATGNILDLYYDPENCSVPHFRNLGYPDKLLSISFPAYGEDAVAKVLTYDEAAQFLYSRSTPLLFIDSYGNFECSIPVLSDKSVKYPYFQFSSEYAKYTDLSAANECEDLFLRTGLNGSVFNTVSDYKKTYTLSCLYANVSNVYKETGYNANKDYTYHHLTCYLKADSFMADIRGKISGIAMKTGTGTHSVVRKLLFDNSESQYFGVILISDKNGNFKAALWSSEKTYDGFYDMGNGCEKGEGAAAAEAAGVEDIIYGTPYADENGLHMTAIKNSAPAKYGIRNNGRTTYFSARGDTFIRYTDGKTVPLWINEPVKEEEKYEIYCDLSGSIRYGN